MRAFPCAALVALTGCSTVFMRPPPDPGLAIAMTPVACTDTYLLPIVDTALTGGTLAASSVFLAHLIGGPHDSPTGAADVTLAIAASLIAVAIPIGFFHSAVHGYVRASRCRSYLASRPAP